MQKGCVAKKKKGKKRKSVLFLNRRLFQAPHSYTDILIFKTILKGPNICISSSIICLLTFSFAQRTFGEQGQWNGIRAIVNKVNNKGTVDTAIRMPYHTHKINKVRRQPTESEKVFANHVTDDGLIFKRTHKTQ